MSNENRNQSNLKPVTDLKNQVSDRISHTMDSVQREASDIQNSISRGAHDVADTVSSKLKSAGVDADKMMDAAKEKTAEYQDLIVDQLRAHPMRALGIAAAVGAVVGFMTAR